MYQFITYDGLILPFDNESFDYVTTRYALHHFPEIQKTFYEISRILKKGGHFFVCDPTPNDDDCDRFVDDFMKMKKDGHIKYYTKDEFDCLSSKAGLKLKYEFNTKISFPRIKETAFEFNDIIRNHKRKVIDGYDVNITKDNKYIYITQNVLNLIFEKV